MATHGIGQPESSDDDSISLTSTIYSEEGGEYEVDRILASHTNESGAVSYLTTWAGYPEIRATWQKRDTFNEVPSEDDALVEWSKTEQRIANGQEEPFDVDAWEVEVLALQKATKARQERRRKKKARLARRAAARQNMSQRQSNSSSDDSDIPLSSVRKSKSSASLSRYEKEPASQAG